MWYVHSVFRFIATLVSHVCSCAQVERHEGTCITRSDMENLKLTMFTLDENSHWCSRRRHRDDHRCCHRQGGTQVMRQLFSAYVAALSDGALGWCRTRYRGRGHLPCLPVVSCTLTKNASILYYGYVVVLFDAPCSCCKTFVFEM